MAKARKPRQPDPNVTAFNMMERIATIERCGLDDVRDIDRQISLTLRQAVAVNSGGWLAFVVPPAIVWYVCRQPVDSAISLLRVLREQEAESVFREPVLA